MPDWGKLVGKAKQLAAKHPDQVSKGVDKVQDVAEQKTGGKYDSLIEQAGDRAEGFLGTQGQDTPGQGTGNQ